MNTLDGAFRETVQRYPDHLALRYYQDECWEMITYRQLNDAVDVIACAFNAIGAGKEDKIAIMTENRPEWMVCYLASVTAGAIAVPIDAQLGEVETEHIINHSAAGILICSMRCYDVVSHIISELTHLKTIVILDRNITVHIGQKGVGDGDAVVSNGRKANGHKTFLSYDELREKGIACIAAGKPVFPEKTPEDMASIIYTSGTTGAAKGVMLTHSNFMSNVESINNLIDVDETDNFLLLLPLHHSFPFTTCLALPFAQGSAISFVDILSRDRTRLIGESQPTVFLGVPILYSKIYKGLMRQIEQSKLKSLLFKYGGKFIIGHALKKKLGGKMRLMVSGAAPMDPEIIRGFTGLGIEFIEGYGLTEASPVVAANPPGNIKIGSVGPALKYVQARILDPDSEGIGELLVKGGNVMNGYYQNPRQTDKVIRDGWLHTGDLGRIDSDGYIFITGRAKDVIVTSGGKNVYPEVVEAVINQSPFIAETIVLGYKTAGKVGEEVGVLVYPEYEALIGHARANDIAFDEAMDVNALTEDAKDELLAKFCQLIEGEVKAAMPKLAPYQRVTRIAIDRDEFTKTSTRKIKRFLYKGRLDIVDIG